MRPALVIGHRVNFIHNHGLDIAQNRPALVGREQNVERLRRRHQNVRRTLQHQPTVFRQRVAGTHRSANLWHQQPALRCQRQNLSQRPFQIFLDVVAQRLQRRNVENFRPVHQLASQRLAHQPVNASQKGSESFARPRRRGNQRGPPRQNVRPALLLRLRRRPKLPHKPLRHDRVGPGERGGNGHGGILARKQSFANHSPHGVLQLTYGRHQSC